MTHKCRWTNHAYFGDDWFGCDCGEVLLGAEALRLLNAHAGLEAIADAADRMAMAYAGEMASRGAGIELRGFPVLEAYQALTSLLIDRAEVKA